jgi:hypothetical protein
LTKLDLALINQRGRGKEVPKEMDLQMVKYVIGNRKTEVENDPDLKDKDPWDHSDVFYQIRTWLNQHGWDTSVYNDDVSGGSKRRKDLYDKIQDVCENDCGVKRHQIGIFPADRAIMAFRGRMYTVGFSELRDLMNCGTDVIVVEKAGTVMKLVKFTSKCGIAFIQSQGFVSEYGIALAAIANGQEEIAQIYTLDNNSNTYYSPDHVGHLGVLTDCDHSGCMIGTKIPGAVRLGIDVTTIDEINIANPGLGLKIGKLVEGTKKNTHWLSLLNLANNGWEWNKEKGEWIMKKGKLMMALSEHDRVYYMNYLCRKIKIGKDGKVKVDNDNVEHGKEFSLIREEVDDGSFLHYLKSNRIELNTILSAIKPQEFWNWLKWKLETLWPERNYNRAISSYHMTQELGLKNTGTEIHLLSDASY